MARTSTWSCSICSLLVIVAVSGAQDNADFKQFGIYANTAPRAETTNPVPTALPLKLNKGDRVALIGNTLLEREQLFGQVEALLQQRYPEHELVVRDLAWPADEVTLQPRPANFADVEQHLTHEKADVILAAFGFNESFAGKEGLPAFRKSLGDYVAGLKTKLHFRTRRGARGLDWS